jgi:hypothetical protein
VRIRKNKKLKYLFVKYIFHTQQKELYKMESKNIDLTKKTLCSTESNLHGYKINTHRFDFTDLIVEKFTYFAKLHEYDDRKTFKESWNTWIKDCEIAEMIEGEQQRLRKDGYRGDVLDKMFKSVRYYFRKKKNDNGEQKQRKKYSGFSNEILDIMDKHILLQIKNNIVNIISNPNNDVISISNITPCNAYADFCKNHQSDIKDEIYKMNMSHQSSNEIVNKFKKTYKNRFYNIKTLTVKT